MKSLTTNNNFLLVVLFALTFLSIWLTQSTMSVWLVATLATISVIIKGQLIVDYFMELYHAPTKWRYLILSYVIILPVVLALIIYL